MTQQVLTRIYVELIQCLVPRFIINLHKHNHDDFLVLALPIGPHQRMTSLSLCPNEGERGGGSDPIPTFKTKTTTIQIGAAPLHIWGSALLLLSITNHICPKKHLWQFIKQPHQIASPKYKM